ncbi:MAG: guanylate kinase [Bacillota bacterium]
MSRSLLFVISGPSGAGKGTLVRSLLAKRDHVRFSVSATTRAPRPGEIHGVDYYFLSVEEFSGKVNRGEFLEWAKVYNNYYGTLREQVDGLLREGYDLLLDVDTQGAAQVKRLRPEAILIFVAAPSYEELARRLRGRGTEDLELRVNGARGELQSLSQYDYLIINEDSEDAVAALDAIVVAEKSRISNIDPEICEKIKKEGGMSLS